MSVFIVNMPKLENRIWEQVTSITGFTAKTFAGHFSDGTKMFIMGGKNAAGNKTTDIQYSSDGATWATSSSSVAAVEANACCDDGGGNGYETYGIGASYFNTVRDWNGTAFAGHTPTGDNLARQLHVCLFYDSKIWIIGGYSSDTVGHITTSWVATDLGSQLPKTIAYHAGCVYDGKMWITGGYDGANFLDNVYSSTNGTTWTSEGTLPAKTLRHTMVVADGKMWVIGGYDADAGGYTNKVYTSTDGSTWIEDSAEVNWDARDSHQAFVLGDSIYITGGNDAGGFKTDIWKLEY